ncbi:MAG: LysE family translocator [Thiohalomonadales bacterium]
MDTTLFISFLIISVGLIIIPGPNVLIIVSTSLNYGKIRGLQTVLGTSLAMIVQLIISGIGTTWFIHFITEGFTILKWLGVAYLLYLGLQYFKNAIYKDESKKEISAAVTFTRGFLVSLTNPKTILFFSAFLPQFVSSSGSYLQQISVLSFTFLLIAVVLDSTYALLSVKLKFLIDERNLFKLQNGVSGLLFIGASAWLATSRRIP